MFLLVLWKNRYFIMRLSTNYANILRNYHHKVFISDKHITIVIETTLLLCTVHNEQELQLHHLISWNKDVNNFNNVIYGVVVSNFVQLKLNVARIKPHHVVLCVSHRSLVPCLDYQMYEFTFFFFWFLLSFFQSRKRKKMTEMNSISAVVLLILT